MVVVRRVTPRLETVSADAPAARVPGPLPRQARDQCRDDPLQAQPALPGQCAEDPSRRSRGERGRGLVAVSRTCAAREDRRTNDEGARLNHRNQCYQSCRNKIIPLAQARCARTRTSDDYVTNTRSAGLCRWSTGTGLGPASTYRMKSRINALTSAGRSCITQCVAFGIRFTVRRGT